ncbi:P21-Rho-binding domain-containing protein [Mycena floridula]|nr:P21-Rho-binding domain-containing protein [Mycena floridula]
MGVSNPTNFVHKVHVGFDPVSGAFTGMPEQWSKLLTKSAITREDYAKDPQAVLDVLEFYTDHKKREMEDMMGPNRDRDMNPSQSNSASSSGRAYPDAPPRFNNQRNRLEANSKTGLTPEASRPAPSPAVVKPLQPTKNLQIVENKPVKPAGTGVAAAAAALEKPKDKEKRISTMMEVQTVETLRQVVCDDNPKLLYSKIKKVGQGASGHVFVAKTLATGKKVAIKEMDLSHQPRKELIVNEIMVMKESQHPNIINFLESYLVKNQEL